jgi:hypothetical protein
MFVTQQQLRERDEAERSQLRMEEVRQHRIVQIERNLQFQRMEAMLPKLRPIWKAFAEAREKRLRGVMRAAEFDYAELRFPITRGKFSLRSHVFSMFFGEEGGITILQPKSWTDRYGPADDLADMIQRELDNRIKLSFFYSCIGLYGTRRCLDIHRFPTQEDTEEPYYLEADAS